MSNMKPTKKQLAEKLRGFNPYANRVFITPTDSHALTIFLYKKGSSITFFLPNRAVILDDMGLGEISHRLQLFHSEFNKALAHISCADTKLKNYRSRAFTSQQLDKHSILAIYINRGAATINVSDCYRMLCISPDANGTPYLLRTCADEFARALAHFNAELQRLGIDIDKL